MVLVVVLSFGISKYFSDRAILLRICEDEPTNCTPPTNETDSIIRNTTLYAVQLLFLHGLTSFIIYEASEKKRNVVRTVKSRE
jgi:hypothetical protein